MDAHSGRHLLAAFGAATASIRAFPHFTYPFTIRGALFADLGAFATGEFVKFRAEQHEMRGCPTNLGASHHQGKVRTHRSIWKRACRSAGPGRRASSAQAAEKLGRLFADGPFCLDGVRAIPNFDPEEGISLADRRVPPQSSLTAPPCDPLCFPPA